MKTKFTALIASAFLVTSIPFTQAQSSYNAEADFNPTNNPNGVWSYGTSTSLGSFTLLTNQFSFASNQMQGWGSDSPFVFVVYNATSGDVIDGTTTYPAETIAVHPSDSGDYAILRWTAPSSGGFSLSLTFSDIVNEQAATVDVHALLNGVSFFNDTLNASLTTTGLSNFPLTVAGGDVLDFVVGNGGNGYANDHTAISAVVTSVPEPSVTAAFIGVAALTLAFTRRRFRKA